MMGRFEELTLSLLATLSVTASAVENAESRPGARPEALPDVATVLGMGGALKEPSFVHPVCRILSAGRVEASGPMRPTATR